MKSRILTRGAATFLLPVTVLIAILCIVILPLPSEAGPSPVSPAGTATAVAALRWPEYYSHGGRYTVRFPPDVVPAERAGSVETAIGIADVDRVSVQAERYGVPISFIVEQHRYSAGTLDGPNPNQRLRMAAQEFAVLLGGEIDPDSAARTDLRGSPGRRFTVELTDGRECLSAVFLAYDRLYYVYVIAPEEVPSEVTYDEFTFLTSFRFL